MSIDRSRQIQNLQGAVNQYVALMDDLIGIMKETVSDIAARAVNDEPATPEDKAVLALVDKIQTALEARQLKAQEALRGDS